MKNNILIEHLANADLSFLKVVKDEVIEVKNKIDIEHFTKTINIKQDENWNKDIEVLEVFFNGIATNKQPIRFNKCTVINDVSLFIDSHFTIIKANTGNSTFLPYLHRLQELKQQLTN